MGLCGFEFVEFAAPQGGVLEPLLAQHGRKVAWLVGGQKKKDRTAMLALVAICSATHDIGCDGLYIASLTEKQQAGYAGWQGAFFNAGRFISLGGLVIL
eukprot:gene55378-73959_t